MVVKKTSLASRWKLLATAIFRNQTLLAQIKSTFSRVVLLGLVGTEGLREVASRCATARNLSTKFRDEPSECHDRSWLVSPSIHLFIHLTSSIDCSIHL